MRASLHDRIPGVTGGVLSGITVLDLTRVLSGPYCTMMLADMGARVIKVEHPRGGDDTRAWGPPFVNGESTYFLGINRNKESVTLDFKKPAGRTILDQLLGRADVVVENFKPGTLERQGLDYASLAPRHPALIYCSISGYGQTGPRRGAAGYDAAVQAEGGVMSVTGPPEGPGYRFGLPIADLATGMFAAQGVLLALIARGQTGRGQHVDLSMLDSIAALLTYQASAYFATGALPPRMGNAHLSIVPYDTFDARDGQVMLAVGNDDQWRRFCDIAGLGELAGDERFATNPQRVVNRAALQPLLDAALLTRDRADWLERCTRAGVPCGAVRNIGETLGDPQLAARGMIASLRHPVAGDIRLVGNPIKLSAHPPRADVPPPVLGEHTESILTRELGLTPDEVRDLRAQEVI
jgi:crotonobetainyl-CoA:carnitine CoA-transferase CaiB-like acyl-CoA transferase